MFGRADDTESSPQSFSPVARDNAQLGATSGGVALLDFVGDDAPAPVEWSAGQLELAGTEWQPRVFALIPAHNEAEGIVHTVRSLLSQTVSPEIIIVMADNCTDDTVELATEAGAQVFETADNRAKKSGALNQGLARVLPMVAEHDVILVMDADSQLSSDFIECGIRHLGASSTCGAISGAYFARPDESRVGLLQKVEYVQGLRVVHRRGGRIHVLSGAAGMFTVGALRQVSDQRGSTLPGIKGWVYHEESLTEDYELTIALKRLGYQPKCARDCAVVTDVMTTWSAWAAQRLRWQRGTLETLFLYGWIPHTRKTWAITMWTYFRSLIPIMTIILWSYAFAFEEVSLHLFWLAIIPVFVVDQVVCSWRAGWRGRLYAACLVPMWLYDVLHAAVYWQALWRSLRRSRAEWT